MPDDFESNFKDGLQLFQKELYEEAILKFKDATYLNPESSESKFYLGLSFFKAGHHSHSIDIFKEVVAIRPSDPESHFYLSCAYGETGQSNEVINELKKAIECDPNNDLYVLYLSMAFQNYKLFEDGILFLRQLIKKSPKYLTYRYSLVTLLERYGSLDEALNEYNQLIFLEPFKTSHYYFLGNLLKKMGRMDEAQQIFERAIQSFPDDEELKKRYQSFLIDKSIDKIVKKCEEKKWKEAIILFQALTATDRSPSVTPQSWAVFQFLNDSWGRTHSITYLLWDAFEEKNHQIDGINLFLRLYPLDPENCQIRDCLTESLRDIKIKKDIIEDYLGSIQRNEDCTNIHFHLINALDNYGGHRYDFQEFIIEEYQKIIILDHTLAYPHFEIGEKLIAEFGKYAEAIPEFYEGLKKDPNYLNGEYRYFFIVALVQEKRIDEAITIFHIGTELEPVAYRDWYDSILSYLIKEGLFDSAEEVFKKSIEIFTKLLESGHKNPGFDLSFSCAHSALGEVYEKMGQFDNALFHYHESAKLYEQAFVHRKIANILIKKNQIDDAISEYRKVIEYEPDSASDHKTLADHLMKNGRYNDADLEYREAVRLVPGNKEYENAWLNLKTALFDKIILDKAIQSELTHQNSSLKGHSQSIDDEFQQLIANGENEVVEFKTSALWSKYYSKEDIENSNEGDVKKFGKDVSKIVIAKTIAGFLNTEGGNLVIGIKENKDGNKDEITGIEGEFSKLKDHGTDGYRRMLIEEIIRKFFPVEIFNHLTNYIKIEFPKCNGKFVCWLKITKSEKPVYLKIQNDDNYFFIRVDASTRQIAGKMATEYCLKRFKEK